MVALIVVVALVVLQAEETPHKCIMMDRQKGSSFFLASFALNKGF